MVHQNRSNFRFWLPVQIWNDLWPIILCNLKAKHRRCIKLYLFWIVTTRQTIWHYFQRNQSMFQYLTHVELSRSMAAILDMWHIRKMLFMLLLNSVQSLTVLTFCAQWMGLATLLWWQVYIYTTNSSRPRTGPCWSRYLSTSWVNAPGSCNRSLTRSPRLMLFELVVHLVE